VVNVLDIRWDQMVTGGEDIYDLALRYLSIPDSSMAFVMSAKGTRIRILGGDEPLNGRDVRRDE
jgi:hypothetical protein